MAEIEPMSKYFAEAYAGANIVRQQEASSVVEAVPQVNGNLLHHFIQWSL